MSSVDVKISIPNEIVTSLNEVGIYNIEQFITKLLDDVVKENKVNTLTDEEQDIIEEQLQGLGYI